MAAAVFVAEFVGVVFAVFVAFAELVFPRSAALSLPNPRFR